MVRAIKVITICALLVIGSAWPLCAEALHEIKGIRHWVAPDHTRVVIDLTGDCRYTVAKGERTLAIDLEETAFPAALSPLIVLNKPGVEGVAVSPRPNSGVRVELYLPEDVQTKVFKLKEFQDKPYRIVVDIVLPDAARRESEAREQVKITRKDRIVVIDPGHGGEAVGAVGRRGTYEKDVVLAIGRKLRKALSGRPGYRAFLTRDGDYYVPFSKRLMIAREYGADIFVSIHADAAKSRAANGSSVYCLSTGGASSAAARILARNENLADVVGGVPAGEGGDASDPVILDMFQTRAINQSRTFGGGLLQHLERVNHLKFATIQEAPFIVLNLPDIPSVLIETAYISNPKEELLLRSDRFQQRIAESIARSIVEFLPPLPPVAVLATGRKDGQGQAAGTVAVTNPAPERPPETAARRAAGDRQRDNAAKTLPAGERISRHRVKRGETLQGIARRYGTSVAALCELNRMKPGDSLHADRSLKISGAREGAAGDRRSAGTMNRTSAAKEGRVVYRVKRGDTLTAIARRHGTTVRVLGELNHLPPGTPLYVDRKLILPTDSSL
ncbi:MAG: N-acetylmuramoyl-L-alanine amidase [Syntrophales bacterium]